MTLTFVIDRAGCLADAAWPEAAPANKRMAERRIASGFMIYLLRSTPPVATSTA
jgi:hypothetical protein